MIQTKCRRTFASITDGASNTLRLGECAARNRRYEMGKENTSDTWTAGPWANPNSRLQIGGYNPASPLTPNCGSDGTAACGPCAVNCVNDKELYGFHPAGANVATADGSVK